QLQRKLLRISGVTRTHRTTGFSQNYKFKENVEYFLQKDCGNAEKTLFFISQKTQDQPAA
ncbi:MAG TPA: hypothetical protein PK573_17050, partial [Spirochaetota bacterium]|nr:hypothetical protein [Spirochaetota bacterium]